MKLILLLFFVFGSIAVCQTTKVTPVGSGTSGAPYQISSLGNLSWLAQNSAEWGKFYIQTKDIDAASSANWDDTDDNSDGDLYNDTNDGISAGNNEGFYPIGKVTPFFTGSYNGQGYTISNLTLSRITADNGLFGMIWQSGSIVQNLNVTNASITSTNNYTGGLAGRLGNSASISNCSSSGSVSGTYYVGGLVGRVSSQTISKCYSTASVSASSSYAGGLIGECSGSTISNCYSRGNVSGSLSSIGGFIGSVLSSTIVEYSYSTGTVTTSANLTSVGFAGQDDGSNTYTNNFFDKEVSSQLTATGATSKTTVEMKTNTTFTSASWSSTIWNIGDGINAGYPYFDWQNTSGTPLPVELTSFTGLVKNNSVVLSWETATEVNNYGFEIQRASSPTTPRQDGWEKIGFEQGYGNSNSAHNYSFTDKNSVVGNYSYRLKQIDTDGQYEYSDVVEISIIKKIPGNFRLAQNYPNPFNPSTTISYSIPLLEGVDVASVQLRIYDILGRDIAELVKTKQSAGTYEVVFDASFLNSGIYFYHLNVVSDNGLFSQVRKMILLK